MVDWKSPSEIARDALAFDRLMHALIGIYCWEWVISLDFDWQFISRKKPFRWPLIFYFLNRYLMLLSLVGIAIALNVTTEIDCQTLYIFTTLFGSAAIGLSSINLSLRTMAVWCQRWYIVVPLTVIILGEWSLLMHGVLVKAAWIVGQGCVITSTATPMMLASFFYAMVLDFIIMLLMVVKLVQSIARSGPRSMLANLVFKDGLLYFFVAFLLNLGATIFMLLNLNPIMSVIVDIPATTISTIVACRVVRRLSNFPSQSPESFPSSAVAFRSHSSTFPLQMSTITDEVPVQRRTFQNSPSEEIGTVVDFDIADQPDNNDNRG